MTCPDCHKKHMEKIVAKIVDGKLEEADSAQNRHNANGL